MIKINTDDDRRQACELYEKEASAVLLNSSSIDEAIQRMDEFNRANPCKTGSGKNGTLLLLMPEDEGIVLHAMSGLIRKAPLDELHQELKRKGYSPARSLMGIYLARFYSLKSAKEERQNNRAASGITAVLFLILGAVLLVGGVIGCFALFEAGYIAAILIVVPIFGVMFIVQAIRILITGMRGKRPDFD